MAHILIVDDSFTEQAGLSQILHKHGHICSFAHTGEMGVASAQKCRPDLILMDVVMPQVNGFQATRQLTKNPRTAHIPVILISTKDQESDRYWGIRQGASEYLNKPVSEDILLAAVNRVLAN